jgi:CheY-like chemotaxis protein/curved DNA-binding protein CbpA
LGKILLVVNNRAELRRLAGGFEEKGHAVIAASDGLSGFEVFEEQRPDAIVIDILIPKLPGGELCRRIKADSRGRTTPVVVLSGLFKKTDMAERALSQWHADRYFQSPVDPNELAAVVEQLIGAPSATPQPNLDAAPPLEPPTPRQPEAPALRRPDPPPPALPNAADFAQEMMRASDPATNDAPRPTPPAAARRVATPAAMAPQPAEPELELEIEDEAELDDLEAAIARAVAELARHDMLDRSPRVARINEDLDASRSGDDRDPLAALLAELDGETSPPEPADYPCEVPEEQTEIGSEGRLSNVSVPELLAHLHYERKTGILELTSRGALKQVYFDEGRAVFVESESRQESLGQILVRHGVITEEHAMLSLANMATYGTRQGGALVQMGILNPMQIYQALRMQMREKLLAVFQWFEGRYYFDEGPFDKTNLTMFELPMPRLILDGILSAYAAESVVDMFSEVLDQPIIPSCMLPLDRKTADLPDEVWKLFSIMDGERTIAEVAAESPADADRTFLYLYAMLILRMFDRRREDETAAPEAPTPAPLPRRIPQAAPVAAAPPGRAAAGRQPAAANAARNAAAPLRAPAPPARATPPAGRAVAPPARATASPARANIAPVRTMAAREALVDIDAAASDDDVLVFADLPPEEGAPSPGANPEADDELIVFADLPPGERAPAANPTPASDDEFRFEFEDDPGAAPPENGDLVTLVDDEAPQFRADAQAEHPEQPEPATELMPIDEEPPSAPEQDEELARQVVEMYLKLDGGNYYELLAVPREADDLTLKLSFHNLMKVFHEDKVRGRLDAEMTEKAERVSQAVTLAYETLSSPKRRAEYDRRLTGEGGELKERRITTILAAERAFNQGMTALRRQKYQEAEKAFVEACEMFPEEGEYHAYLGWARFNNPQRHSAERMAMARDSIERALRLNPKGDKAYFFFGKLLLAHGSRDKARQMFALAFRYNKNNEEAKTELRRLQSERERERAEIEAHAEKGGISNVLKKDVDFDTVKRAVKKLFS